MSAPDVHAPIEWDVNEFAALGYSLLGSAVSMSRLGHTSPLGTLDYLHSDQTEWNVDFLLDYLRACKSDKAARERIERFLWNSGAMAFFVNRMLPPEVVRAMSQ